MIEIAVIDYGAGNLASVLKALRAAGAEPVLATTPEALAGRRAIVVPGVGHFQATATLNRRWRAAIVSRVEAGVALLGICLGMQWLFEGSAEAPGVPGLGVFAGRCERLSGGASAAGPLKVPHVGWNTLTRTGAPSRLLEALPPEPFAYFTHTFAAPAGDGCTATTWHGETCAAVVEHGRVCGVQWHPEKSAGTGITVLRAFVRVAQEAA